MNEKQIISAIKQLKEIKPRKEWVFLLKSEILNLGYPLGREINPKFSNFEFRISNFFFGFKTQKSLAYAFATLLFIVVGVLGFAQYTVPGDLLFSVKKLAEQSQTAFMQDQLKYNFEIANKRLQDLTQVVKENRTENIAAAVSEFKASMADATKNLVQSISGSGTAQGAPRVPRSLKEIAAEVKKIQDNQKQAETLGIDISQTEGIKELDNVLAPLVQAEITDLEKTTLTEEQQKALEEIKELYDQQKYSDALEEILLINK